MSALDLLKILSAPAASSGGRGASADADADVAEAFAGFLALQTPANTRAGQPGAVEIGVETTPRGPEEQALVLRPPFAPPPAATDVAAAPLLATQGPWLDAGQMPGETPAAGLAAPEGGVEGQDGQDGQTTTPPALVGAGGPAPLQTRMSAPGLTPDAASAAPASRTVSPSSLPASAAEMAMATKPEPADSAVKTGSLSGAVSESGDAPTPSLSTASPATPPRAALTPAPAVASTPALPDESAGRSMASTATVTPETEETAASALQKSSSGAVEAIQMAARGAGAGPPGEPGRMMQGQRPLTDEAGRRSDRREPFMNPLLTTASETGDAPRAPSSPQNTSAFSAVLQPGGLNMAHAQPQAAQPGQIRSEIAPPPVEAVLPQGEGEAARALDTAASAPLSARDGLPSGLSRATIETTALMAAQIVRRLEGRSTRFEMALTPEGLGRVNVSMEIDSDGQLAARLAFDNPAAAAELRGRVDDLRRQLEASGFRVGEDALEFTDRETARDHGADHPFDRRPGRAFAGAGQLIDDAPASPPPPRWAALALTPEGVDMKV